MNPMINPKFAMKRLVFALLAVAPVPGAAKAGLSCALDVSPVQFDSISGTSAGTFDARGAVTVACTGSNGATIAACIEIGEGAARRSSGERALSAVKGVGTLPLQIFQDTTLARPWSAGTGQALVLQRTGDGPLYATVYLRAFIQRGAALPGAYFAQFPVTLRYGTAAGNFVDCNALGTASAIAPTFQNRSAPVSRRRS